MPRVPIDKIEPNHIILYPNNLMFYAILDRISILARETITPGQTLLFLDEIQECPKAITALRYFDEKLTI